MVSQLSSNNIVFHHFFFLLKWFSVYRYIIFFVCMYCIVECLFFLFCVLFEDYELCVFKCVFIFSLIKLFRFVMKCAHTQAALSSLDFVYILLLVSCVRMQSCVCVAIFHFQVADHPCCLFFFFIFGCCWFAIKFLW